MFSSLRMLTLLSQAHKITVSAPGKLSRAETVAAIAIADGLIIRSQTQVDAALLAAAPRLKVLVRAGAGIDNVDLAEATRLGIVVMNTPGGNTTATAEYAFGLMLALVRHIPAAHQSLAEGQWDRKAFMGTELSGKTLGIIGFGRVGRAVASRAVAFGMTVLAYDTQDLEEMARAAAAIGASLVSLDELYARSDVISLHPALNDETRGMINANSIARMKPGVWIVNAARGALIVEDDLAAAIKSGHVAGAALDVYAHEPPPPDHPLLRLPGVIHTPHVAASTREAQQAVAVQAARQMVDALVRGCYAHVQNPQVLEGHTRMQQ